MAKIVIVEDDLKLANTYKDKLVEEGHEVHISEDVKGLSTITSVKPDLVILDILMPKVSGLTILRQVKENSDLEDIPVLILTNVEGASEVEQAIELGASGYLVKSDTTLDLLAAKAREILSSEAISTGIKG